MEANIESIANLATNLRDNGFDIRTIPYVLQLNKRDMPSAAPVMEMERLLRFHNEPMIEAVASRGTGVLDALKACARQILMELQKA
jgi:signal recognition particle receptor subunit beta